jgi:hypothetical protein
LGLERFAPPLLISGRVDLVDADLSRATPLYLGISPNEADRARFRERPAYVLTIENFASFSRHVIEADPQRIGTTLYVGGDPSLATQQALRNLVAMLADTSRFFIGRTSTRTGRGSSGRSSGPLGERCVRT